MIDVYDSRDRARPWPTFYRLSYTSIINLIWNEATVPLFWSWLQPGNWLSKFKKWPLNLENLQGLRTLVCSVVLPKGLSRETWKTVARLSLLHPDGSSTSLRWERLT